MINSRSLKDLDADFRGKVLDWLFECSGVGLDVMIVSTYRDAEWQNKLYEQGRTTAGKICTWAKGGESKHQTRKALDYCIMRGKECDWLNTGDFTKAGIIAERHGLVWAGRWNGKIKELGHIEAH